MMKKNNMKRTLFVFFCLFILHGAMADVDLRIQMLDTQIEKLEAERAKKLEKLNMCQKQSTEFQVAGLSTLALTGVGIYANVKLNNKLHNRDSAGTGGGTKDSNMKDNRSQSDKNCESARELLSIGIATQEEVDETCGGQT